MVIHITKQKFWVHWRIFVKICWENLHFDLKYAICHQTPHFIRILRGINGNKQSVINSLLSLNWSTGGSFFGILLAEIEFEIWTQNKIRLNKKNIRKWFSYHSNGKQTSIKKMMVDFYRPLPLLCTCKISRFFLIIIIVKNSNIQISPNYKSGHGTK